MQVYLHQPRIRHRFLFLTLFVTSLVLAAVISKQTRSVAAALTATTQATSCAVPNLQLAKQITLDPGAEHFFVAGDFNRDGNQDLVVYTAVGKMYTLLGSGTGNFFTATTALLPGGGPRLQIGSGDFNGDGKADLAAANNGSGTVSVLVNGCVK
ncbi:MAG: VCBS repeat-containing protein [Blastocatellia bacterium]